MLRTLSTTRLIALAAVVVTVAIVGATVAVAASGGGGATPPPAPLATAVHDALAAQAPAGVTARITFTNKLFPSGALVGATGSALMSGATGRLWVNDTGGRLELQSDAGDVQVTWNDTKATVYDASSNTAYTFDLPQHASDKTGTQTVPSVDEITTFLTDLSKHWTVSGAEPSNVAGEQAYTVKVSPSHDGGLLGSARLAWDALNGIPLRVAIYAQGASTPALALEATDISFGDVSNSDVQVPPPAGAKVVDLSSATNGGTGGTGSADAPVVGLAAVQAAAGFPVTAPDTLVGLPRQDIRLVGPADSRAALVVYGQGLGAIVVVERAKDTSGGSGAAGAMSSLPAVSVDGVTGHELATQLGTIITWDRGGVTYVLAGSIPNGAAETAAASLK
jgi:hypothetical protein